MGVVEARVAECSELPSWFRAAVPAPCTTGDNSSSVLVVDMSPDGTLFTTFDTFELLAQSLGTDRASSHVSSGVVAICSRSDARLEPLSSAWTCKPREWDLCS